MVHFLYIFMNSFSVIFLLRSSSNSHTIRSTSVLPIRTLIRLRVSRTSSAVKNLWAWGADREWKTRSRYFSSVVLILNSYSFSSMVFSFSALRSRSFCMLNSNFPSLPRFSFSKTMLFLYFRCSATGRSRRRMGFFYSFCIIIQYPSQNFHSFMRKALVQISVQQRDMGWDECLAVFGGYNIALSCINKMSEVRINRSADEIETALNQTLAQMHEHQKNGNYVEAETQRLASEQLRRDLEARRVYEMEQRHAQEDADLDRAHNDQLNHFNSFWDKKMSEFAAEGERMVHDLEAKHQADADATRADLEKQLPLKVKESSQFLNLKRMEENMAKQKLYNEAHKVQMRLAELEKSEKEAWINARNLKIETAINTLRARQAAELAALQKKIRTGVDEQTKERTKEQARLNQKYANIKKELRGNHEKEVMAFRGQFRSKGGQGSPLLLTKSKLLSSK